MDGTLFYYSGAASSKKIDCTIKKDLYICGPFESGSNNVVGVIGINSEGIMSEVVPTTSKGEYFYYKIGDDIVNIIVNLSFESSKLPYAFLTDEQLNGLNQAEKEYVSSYKQGIFGVNENSFQFIKFPISGNETTYDEETKTINFAGTGDWIAVNPVYKRVPVFDDLHPSISIWIGKLQLVSISDRSEKVSISTSFDNLGDAVEFNIGDTKDIITVSDGRATANNIIKANKNSVFKVISGQSFYLGSTLKNALIQGNKYVFKEVFLRLLNCNNIVEQAAFAYSVPVEMPIGFNRIVCFGDSISAVDSSWLYRVAKRLNLPYTNLAVSGTRPTYDSNLSPENLAKIPTDTGIVVITGGWNAQDADYNPSNHNYDRDKDNNNTKYGGVCNAIKYIRKNHPMARIILATPSRNSANVIVQPWCDIFRTIAEKQNIILADVDKYGDWEYIGANAFYDGLHPNSNGSNRIAAIILNAIRKIIC